MVSVKRYIVVHLIILGGGHVDAIKFLLERGADPNKRGQFMRTPLYRAAFAGHLEACEVILFVQKILETLNNVNIKALHEM